MSIAIDGIDKRRGVVAPVLHQDEHKRVQDVGLGALAANEDRERDF